VNGIFADDNRANPRATTTPRKAADLTRTRQQCEADVDALQGIAFDLMKKTARRACAGTAASQDCIQDSNAAQGRLRTVELRTIVDRFAVD
jgi:hypothetical protein